MAAEILVTNNILDKFTNFILIKKYKKILIIIKKKLLSQGPGGNLKITFPIK